MPSYSCRTFAIDLSILALLILPAASHMSEIGGRRDDWISIVESWPTLGMMRFVEVYFLAATIGLISVLVVHVRMRRSLFRPLFVHYLFLIACWCAVPILLAWSATVFKIAPLAMLRYVVVSILAPIVYVGFCCAMIDSTRLRAMFATFILFVAVSTCSILYSWQMHGRLDVRRSENWPRVVELVNADKACEHWPVYVGAGLIEDHVLAQKHTKAFHRYCLFPVMSIYRIDGEHREIEPFPIFYAVQNWTAFESTLPGIRKRMKRSGGAWFVLRQDKQGARQLAELIANELGAEVEVVFASRSLNLIKIVQR